MNTTTIPNIPPTAPQSLAAGVEVIARIAREGVARHTAVNLSEFPENAKTAPLLVWPDRNVTDLEGALAQPLRKRGTACLVTVDSFCAYVIRHRQTNTTLAGDANEKGGRFDAILDHYDNEKRGWGEHTAVLSLQPTPEWVRWTGISGKDLDQRMFAEFIEDNAADIIVPELEPKAPNCTDLMQVATTLQIKTDVRFASTVNLQNGQVQLTYEEMIDGTWGGGGKVAVPQCFWIAVVPFKGSSRYAIKIRLRYRGSQGKASFKLELERPHKVVELAFGDMKTAIEEATGIEVLVGTVTVPMRPRL